MPSPSLVFIKPVVLGNGHFTCWLTIFYSGLSEGRASRYLAPSQPRTGRHGDGDGGRTSVGFGLGGRPDDRRGDLQPCIALPVGVSPSKCHASSMLPAVGLISAVRPTVPTRVCTAAGNRLTTGSIMPRVILHGACVPPGCRGAVGTPVRTPKLPAGFIGPFAAQPQGFWTRSQEALRREGLRRSLVFSPQPVTCVGRRDRQLEGFKSTWKSTSALRKWK